RSPKKIYGHPQQVIILAVSVKIDTVEKASRLEVIIRIPMAIIFYIIGIIVGIIFCILLVINIITCLIIARRVAPQTVAAIVAWITEVYAYFSFAVDERPSWFPKM
ncbi:MAG: DUF4389 domain-containing protein, partial [Candidatus Diapherotrites archaeon]|nr:DUF4389 domain-containing protein [Candidatus Diapherotrites archaeon]